MRACTVPGTCLQPKRSPQPQRSRSAAVHTLQAAAQPAAGGEAADGGGGPPARPRRERVNFAVPGQEGLYRAEHVVQRDLDAILATLGALGFENPSGAISRRLEDLPEGGTVNLVMPREPPLATQVRPWFACRRRWSAFKGRVGHVCCTNACRWTAAHRAATACARRVPADPRPLCCASWLPLCRFATCRALPTTLLAPWSRSWRLFCAAWPLKRHLAPCRPRCRRRRLPPPTARCGAAGLGCGCCSEADMHQQHASWDAQLAQGACCPRRSVLCRRPPAAAAAASACCAGLCRAGRCRGGGRHAVLGRAQARAGRRWAH